MEHSLVIIYHYPALVPPVLGGRGAFRHLRPPLQMHGPPPFFPTTGMRGGDGASRGRSFPPTREGSAARQTFGGPEGVQYFRICGEEVGHVATSSFWQWSRGAVGLTLFFHHSLLTRLF